MDRELMREYQVLRDLLNDSLDRDKPAAYIALRLEQYGLSVRTESGLVTAWLRSNAPGPEITFGCAYDAQSVNNGVPVHARGNDGLCAMILTVMQRLFYRGGIERGTLCVQFHNSAIRQAEDATAELLLTGDKTVEITARGTGPLADRCAEAVQSVMGKVNRVEGPTAILLGAAAAENPESGALDYKKIALENGADILEHLIVQALC